MKILLRSTFLVGPDDHEELFKHNFMALNSSGLGFELAEDTKIWEFIQTFVEAHSHVPKLQTVRNNFERSKEMEIIDRLEILATVQPLTRGDFHKRLEDKSENRRSRSVKELLKDTAAILETGLEVKEGREKKQLRGSFDAIHHFLESSHGIVIPTSGQQLSGIANKDSAGFWEHYEKVKREGSALGHPTGLEQIDEVIKGAKKYELWIHSAFAGGMKSTLMLNWAYTQSVYYNYGSLIFSLEMPYHQVRTFLVCLHTFHPKFRDLRIKYGIQDKPETITGENRLPDTNDRGLSYTKVRDAELSDDEEAFLHIVTEDFDNPKNGYGDIHIEVPNPDKSDVTIVDVKARAEVIYANSPFAIIFVDHFGLMAPRRWVPSTTERQNEVLRDAKRLSMNFNRGQGIAVVGLFQINREGYRAAEKNGGKYNMTHLSYANECSVAGTQVLTDVGIVPIESVKIGDQVWSRSGWKQVIDFFDQGIRSVWRVTNDRGEFLEATANHRVRVLRDETVRWSQIDELIEGDWLLGTEGDYPWSNQVAKLPELQFVPGEKPNGEQGIPITVPTHLNEDCAYLLGAWDGDGAVHPKGLGFTGDRTETSVRDEICRTFKSCFGHELGLSESPSRPGSFDLSKWSQPLKRWFERLAGPRGKTVPEVVKQAPRNLVLEYMRGLFDTDGWVNNQGVVGIKMKSEHFLREVQVLMTALGIDTVLEPNDTTLAKTGKTYQGWTLRIRNTDSKRQFQREIGFSEPDKASMLEATFAKVPKDKRVYPVGRIFAALASDYTPYSMITSGRIRRSYNNAVRKAKTDGMVSHGAVQILLQVLAEDGLDDLRADLLREVVFRRVTKVSKIEADVRHERVYDLEVGGDHEFQTGPFLSHNCERSADVITAGWLDDNLRKAKVLFLQCLKSRDQAPFDDFYATFMDDCRRLITCDTSVQDMTAQWAAEAEAKGGGGGSEAMKTEDVGQIVDALT